MSKKDLIPALIFLLTIASCSPREMPITTTSEEARELFIEGRNLYENYMQEYADSLFLEAIKLDPDFALAHLWRYNNIGVTYAYQLINEVSHGESLMIKAFIARMSNDFQLCRILVDSLLDLYPRDRHCLLFAGEMWSSIDELQAIRFYNKAIKLDKLYAAPHIRSAVLMKRLNMYDEVNESYLKYFDLNPGTGASMVAYGNYLLEIDKDTEALKQYKTALMINPNYIYAYWYVIWTNLRMGNYADAVDYCKIFHQYGIKYSQNQNKSVYNINDMVLSFRAAIQFVQNDFEGALVFIDSLISDKLAEGDNIGILRGMNQKAWYQMMANQFEPAFNTLNLTLKLIDSIDCNPDEKKSGYLWNYGTMSILNGKIGDIEKAAEYLKKSRMVFNKENCSESDSKFMSAVEAAYAIQKGDFELAISHAKLPADQASLFCRYYLARAYELRGDKEGARKYYKLICDIINPYYHGIFYNKCRERLKALAE